jgi:hypothetical protein
VALSQSEGKLYLTCVNGPVQRCVLSGPRADI